MPGGILDSAHTKARLGSILKHDDNELLALDKKEKKVKVGYSKAGETRFQNLSDTAKKTNVPVLVQNPNGRYTEKTDGNGNIVYEMNKSDKAEYISGISFKIANLLDDAINERIKNSVAGIYSENGIEGQESGFASRIAQQKAEIRSETMALIGKTMLGGKDDVSGYERVSVGKIREAAAEADKFIDKQVQDRIGKYVNAQAKFKKLGVKGQSSPRNSPYFPKQRTRAAAKQAIKAGKLDKESSSKGIEDISSTATTSTSSANLSASPSSMLILDTIGQSFSSLPEVETEMKAPSHPGGDDGNRLDS